MSRLISSGFETNNLTPGVEVTAVTGSPTIVTSPVATGTYALKIIASSKVSYKFADTLQAGTFYARFRFRKDANPASTLYGIASIGAVSSSGAYFSLETDGSIGFFDEEDNQVGDYSDPLANNTYYNIEVKITPNFEGLDDRTLEWKIDGAFIGVTHTAYNYGVNYLHLGNVFSVQPNFYFDDVVVNDTLGNFNNSWVGEAPTALSGSYNISIAGVDRTGDVINQSVVIEDTLNDKANTCTFALIDRSNSGAPATDDEIIIQIDDDNKIFAGYIIGVQLNKQSNGVLTYQVNCTDYTYILDRYLAHRSYEDETDAEIITDLISRYCVGLGVTTTNVIEGVTVNSIKFNYVQISQAIRKIAQLTGRNWYIDYDKDVHYFPQTTDPAPFNIESGANEYSNLNISKDTSQLKNRVYVRGGTKLSDPTTYSVKGDGAARQFPLPDKPHDVTITVNGVAKTLGIKNVDTTGYQYYLNFQEKYIEQDSGLSVLATTDTLAVTYTYDIPILVAVEDTASIAENGVKEFAIFDKSINTTQAARDRASAELTDYANDIIEGSFTTETPGFRSGQYININLSEYDVDDDYIVQKVVARSLGAGKYVYTISIASSKTMGIIKFLIGLLEANKNLIELDDNEVVDELLQVQDSLLSDSLTDLLTIDSSGAYFTWCTDSLQSTPITRARWDLFQWG
jgi:hypothetical protein